MKRFLVTLLVACSLAAVTIPALEAPAHARAGGGRSIGSGSRSYTPRPTAPYPSAPSPYQMQQPQQRGGGFLRSLGGGILGGILGGMLFRGFGGGGLFGLILLAGGAFVLFRLFQVRRQAGEAAESRYYGEPAAAPRLTPVPAPHVEQPDVTQGISHIQTFDPTFTPEQLCEAATDIFFRVQAAWMNRDLRPVRDLLGAEIAASLQGQVEELLRARMVNHLENVAVRGTDLVDAWQESGEDRATVLFRASLLDYTTDDDTGAVVSGSRTEPVPFREQWTLARSVGSGSWRLIAIDQV